MIRIIIEIDPASGGVHLTGPGPSPGPDHAPPSQVPGPGTHQPAAQTVPRPPGPESSEESIKHGRSVFFDVLTLWMSGYGDTAAPQPDRATALGKVFQVRRDAWGLKAYLEHMRSLEAAIVDCYPATAPLRAADLAANMAQVASAMQFPIIPRIYYEGVGLRTNPEPGANT